MYIFSADALRTAVEAATGGHVTVLYDANNNPHYMRVIPKFTYEDLGLDGSLGTGVATAFLVDGDEVGQIFVGQHLATELSAAGDYVTLPNMPSLGDKTYANARAAVAGMGRGWHLMTIHEWAAIVWWMKANDRLPDDYAGGVAVAGWPDAQLAQSPAPPIASHDKTAAGIAGMHILTLVDLIKLDTARVKCPADNLWD